MLKRIVLTLVILSFLLVSLYPAGGNWLATHTYRKLVTVQDAYINGDLSNFPAYVYLDPTGSGSGLAGKIRNDGYDVVFTDNDGDTVLTHEREYYVEADSNSEGFFWVDVPNLYASPTGDQNKIYMYYGDADASDTSGDPWDATYLAVYHIDGSYDGTPNEVVDSAGTNHGQGDPSPTQTSTAMIYKAQSFDDTDDVIDLPVMALGGNDGSMSAWVKYADTSPSLSMAVGRGGSNEVLGSFSGNTYIVRFKEESVQIGAIDTNWHHLAGTYDGSLGSDNIKLYNNGVNTISGDMTNNNTDEAQIWQIGANGATSLLMDGIVDEVRISSDIRSADWILFEYRNISEGDNELTWGSEEEEDGGEEENAIFFGINFLAMLSVVLLVSRKRK